MPDRYAPIGAVASGGMASVWAAHDRKLEREVAVKVLAAPFARDVLAVRRFKREARAAARLSGHPNVVTIFDVGQRPASDEAPAGRPYIVMEFMAGGTVADAARLGDVSPAEAVAWLQAASAALDHAHARGVIHRDLKLANFLLDDHRVLHVADFGIASLGSEDTLTGSGVLLGTAAYLAPERALGQPATPASDRYSLAICAFELLVGERPFLGEESVALARQQIEEPPPRASARNPRLPRELDAVLARGMDKRPEERWPSAKAFADAVEAALATNPGRALPPVPTAAGGGRARRAVPIAAVAAAALVAGIAAGANSGGGPAQTSAQVSRHASTHRPGTPSKPTTRQPPRQAATSATTAQTATPAASQPTTTTASPGPDGLETRGHALMVSGQYQAAIAVLKQAVAHASPGSLTYAYALYDLGRSLRLAGDPEAAIPVLSRRLAIPNQTGVVRAELEMAMRAAGQTPAAPGSQSSGGSPAAPRGPRHPHHRWTTGGAATAQDG
jgi:tetratricopeptide (TPR) repeat protein